MEDRLSKKESRKGRRWLLTAACSTSCIAESTSRFETETASNITTVVSFEQALSLRCSMPESRLASEWLSKMIRDCVSRYESRLQTLGLVPWKWIRHNPT